MWTYLANPASKLGLRHLTVAVCLLAGCSSAASEGQGGSDAVAGSSNAAGKAGSAGNPAGGSSSTGGDSSTAGSGSLAGNANGGSEAGGTGGGAVGGTGGKGSDDVPGKSEYGFNVRKPGAMNLDWLCTFEGKSYFYARLLQTGTEQKGIAETPVYKVELAQISVDGSVSELANTKYDYGGGHHNDALSFDYEGATHSYYHSSFGFGFRSCQPMDCRNVYALGTTTLQTEGCAPARSLPETCVSIEADGTHAMLEDTFVKCQGDSR